jgi:hypothetical protein
MSSLFHSYEQELNALITSLKARAASAQGMDDRFGEDLREAESLITQLEIEARASGSNTAGGGGGGNEIKNRVNRFKEDLKYLRERSSLLSGGTKTGDANLAGSRNNRFHDDDETLDRSSQVSLLLNSLGTVI